MTLRNSRPARIVWPLLLLALSACAGGAAPSLAERDFIIASSPEPAAVNLKNQYEPLLKDTINSYVTLVVSEDFRKVKTGRDGLVEDTGLTAGSGFFIDPTHVVTAGHVALQKDLMVDARGADGRIHAGKVGEIQPGNDLAMLNIPDYQGEPVRPAASACLKRGEAVFSLGKPHSMADTARFGTVESMSFGQAVSYQGFGYPDAMVLRMATRKGESGGPLFNSRGELVGMIVSTLSDPQGNPLDLAHAVPLPAIADFVCSQGSCPAEWAALRGQSTLHCPLS